MAVFADNLRTLSCYPAAMTDERLHYTSYLVRVWQEEAVPPALAQWRAEVEHVQSGVRQRFESPAALWTFLRQLEPMGDNENAIDF
ncbi:MAG TPA: hypothetical protein GX400_17300 [Chloroflexi bacterium]|nr:hypothetical protein [Chloroflexota bacterium]